MEIKTAYRYNQSEMRKKTKLYIYSIVSGCAAGTLIWEILQRFMQLAGFDIDLSAGPVGFDLSVISVYFKINPGTLAGGIITWFMVKKI